MTALKRPPHEHLEHELLVAWLDEAHVGLVVLDSAGKVVMLNAAAGRKLHVDPLHMFHAAVAELFEHVDVPISVLQWLVAPGFDGQKTLQGARGSKQRLLVKTSTVHKKGQHYKVLAISDVSALWQAQDEANTLTRQWDALNAAITVADARRPDCPIVYVNPRFERMTGYTAAECVGRNCRFLQGTDRVQAGLPELREGMRAQRPTQVLLRNYRKDGSLFWVEVCVSPIHNADGELTHFVAIQQVRDIPAWAAAA